MKRNRLFLILLLAAILACSSFVGVFAAEPAGQGYYDWDAGSKSLVLKQADRVQTLEQNAMDVLGTPGETTWYYMPANAQYLISHIIKIQGDVRLILGSGSLLTADCGINVPKGHSFTVYTESLDNQGTLHAIGTQQKETVDGTVRETYTAGIGGMTIIDDYYFLNNYYEHGCGDITINGGNINAEGYHNVNFRGNPDDCNAAIGGSYACDSGNITVNAGNVVAKGGLYSTAIGAGMGKTVLFCAENTRFYGAFYDIISDKLTPEQIEQKWGELLSDEELDELISLYDSHLDAFLSNLYTQSALEGGLGYAKVPTNGVYTQNGGNVTAIGYCNIGDDIADCGPIPGIGSSAFAGSSFVVMNAGTLTATGIGDNFSYETQLLLKVSIGLTNVIKLMGQTVGDGSEKTILENIADVEEYLWKLYSPNIITGNSTYTQNGGNVYVIDHWKTDRGITKETLENGQAITANTVTVNAGNVYALLIRTSGHISIKGGNVYAFEIGNDILESDGGIIDMMFSIAHPEKTANAVGMEAIIKSGFFDPYVSNISISGGYVFSHLIGGIACDEVDIRISGGKTDAGIIGAFLFSNNAKIHISGGIVNASGKTEREKTNGILLLFNGREKLDICPLPGIGTSLSRASEIKITGGTVSATGAFMAPGIGCTVSDDYWTFGSCKDSDQVTDVTYQLNDIKIYGGKVTAQGGAGAPGLGYMMYMDYGEEEAASCHVNRVYPDVTLSLLGDEIYAIAGEQPGAEFMEQYGEAITVLTTGIGVSPILKNSIYIELGNNMQLSAGSSLSDLRTVWVVSNLAKYFFQSNRLLANKVWRIIPNTGRASVFANVNVWVIGGMVIVIAGAVTAVVITKKKKAKQTTPTNG